VLVALAIYVFILLQKPTPNNATATPPAPPPIIDDPPLTQQGPDPVMQRDKRVLEDPLYPPMARQGADNTRALMQEPRLHPSRATDSFDSYRLVGYLVSQEDRNDTWKLFAREKYPRRSDADFYVSSANRNMETKLPLPPDSTSPRLRDLYALPDYVQINQPLFDKHPYAVVQLPPPNLGTGYM